MITNRRPAIGSAAIVLAALMIAASSVTDVSGTPASVGQGGAVASAGPRAPSRLVPPRGARVPRGPVVTLASRSGEVDELELPGANALVIIELALEPSVKASRPTDRRLEVDARLDRLKSELQEIVDRKSAGGGTIRLDHRYRTVFAGASVELPSSMVRDVEALPSVRSVHVDARVHAYLNDSVPAIGADTVWQRFGVTGEGVTVAVIDSGVDYGHPDLGGGFGPGFKVVGGYDFVDEDADPLDEHGHGTHVAGIVAADGDVVGVAPGATIVAYRVLDEHASGQMSDIVAAIEAAVDPNGDGDASDHVDVVNLSLGGPGYVGDPATTAVENAVRAGVVVCVAAGNSGSFNSLGSPAVAPAAITVGAVDRQGAVARFSSRGPAPGSLDVKPEVLAPGVDILSTLPDGGHGRMSGTSMAAPHAAGVAALLRQMDPAMDALEVKSRIVSAAAPVDDDVMATGAGALDAFGAATVGIVADPAQLAFGLDDLDRSTWEVTRTVRFTNRSSAARMVEWAATGAPPGVTVVARPAQVELEPGATAEIDVTLGVDNARVPFPLSASLAYGGRFELDGDSARSALPWGFVKSCRLGIRTSSESPYVTAASDERIVYASRSGEARFEALMPPGRYDLVVVEPPRTGSDESSPLRLLVREELDIDGFEELDLRLATTPHRVTVAAEDESGVRLSALHPPFSYDLTSSRWWASHTRIIYPAESSVEWLDLGFLDSDTIEYSEMSRRFTVLPYEQAVDLVDTNKVYSVQHRALHGVNGSVTARPDRLVRQPVRIEVPRVPSELFAAFVLHDRSPARTVILQWGRLPVRAGPVWKGEVIVSPDVHPTYATTVAFATKELEGTGFLPTFDSLPLRVEGDVVLAAADREVSTATYRPTAGDALVFGGGPPHMWTWLSLSDVAWHTPVVVRGPLDEERQRDRTNDTWTLVDSKGDEVASGEQAMNISIAGSLPSPGAYSLTVRNEQLLAADGRPAAGELVHRFDTRTGDGFCPTLTSYRVIDSHGVPSATLGVGERGHLRFSAADYELGGGGVAFLPIDQPATKVRFRRDGGEWQTLDVTHETTDAAGTVSELGHRPSGSVFSVDLSRLTDREGLVDLAVEVADRSGQTISWILSPAIAIEAPVRVRQSGRVRLAPERP